MVAWCIVFVLCFSLIPVATDLFSAHAQSRLRDRRVPNPPGRSWPLYPQCGGSVVYYTWRVGICVWASVFGCAHAGIRVRLPLTADGDEKGGVATQQGHKHIHEKHVNAGLGEQIPSRL